MSVGSDQNAEKGRELHVGHGLIAEGGKDSDSSSSHEKDRDSKKSDPDESGSNIPPRKRKLRQRAQIEMTDDQKPSSIPIPPPTHFEKPENPYELFLEIRKQVSSPVFIPTRLGVFCKKMKSTEGKFFKKLSWTIFAPTFLDITTIFCR